jgi:hypothetical protein
MGKTKSSSKVSKEAKSKKGKPGKGTPQEAPKAARPGESPLPPAEIDVALFEAAYERVATRAQALPGEQVQAFNADLQQVALVALRVSQTASEPRTRKRFTNLAKTGEYSDAPVDALAEEAMATWYARYRSIHAERATGVPPQELAGQGYKLRSRMLRVLEYNLEENEGVMKQVAIIRVGSGYLDLANDLTALAELYERNGSALTVDQRHYRKEDAAEARRVASALLTHLGGGTSAPPGGWQEMQARCWTLLNRTYREVRRGGLFLFPNEEGERRFPALLAATREIFAASSKPKGSPEPTPAP